MDKPPPDRLLTTKETCALFNWSPATYWRRVADGTIPPPIKIGGVNRSSESEMKEIIENAKAQRGAT